MHLLTAANIKWAFAFVEVPLDKDLLLTLI